MNSVAKAIESYAQETHRYAELENSTEATYYPSIRNLLMSALSHQGLPFEVRTGTSELRRSRGRDAPDFVLSDSGLLVSAFGEVKLPDKEIPDMAVSEDRDDQIGRYLAQTGVVLLSNVRSVGLLVCKPNFDRIKVDRVPPSARELSMEVSLWRNGRDLPTRSAERLCEMLERAVLNFAPIAEPKSLARILARQARDAKESLPKDLRTVRPLIEDYKEALGLTFDVDDEKGDAFFRSTLIQTAFYSLFAAWALWQRADDGRRFEWDRIDRYLRMPFLASLFHEFRNPVRLQHLRMEAHLDRATETLNRVDLQLFKSRLTFPSIDDGDVATVAMTYFYEPFLEAFDPELRKTLGVWYTPPEVVRYQVQRAHELLKGRLNCPRGLADENVFFLDPCCGTGAYLLEAVRCIAQELRQSGDEGIVGLAILRALTTRIIGFEILTAPYAIAQLQLFVMLSDLGAPPPNEARLRVHLTNALTGWQERKQLRLNFPELQEEYDEAQALKHEANIIVVMGNPPYDRFTGVAIAEESDLIDPYKGIRRRMHTRRDGTTVMEQDGPSDLYTRFGVRKHLLNDLYVRFFRLADQRIGENSEIGLISLISNSSWLTGRSHPLMRESLLANFHEAWIDNLNGDKYRTGKIVPRGKPGAGTSDQSIFSTDLDSRGIQTGTAIATFLKHSYDGTDPTQTVVHYRDLWGKASAKRAALLSSIDIDSLDSIGPNYMQIAPTETTRWRLAPHEEAAGYDAWPSLDELFPAKFQGVNPNRGITGSVIDTNREALIDRMRGYFESASFAEIEERYPELTTPRAGYNPKKVWEALRASSRFDVGQVVQYLLFPLDNRWLYYEPLDRLLNRRRPEYWEQLPDNTFLITVPEPRKVSEAKPLLSDNLVDLHVHDRGSVCIPRHIRGGDAAGDVVANILPSAWRALRAAWHMRGEVNGHDAQRTVLEIFRCAIAILHAPSYGEEHKSALSADWARIPIPRDPEIRQSLSRIGADVATLLDPTKDPAPVVGRVLGADLARTIGFLTKTDSSNISERDLEVTVSYFAAARGRFVVREDGQLLGGPVGDLYINNHTFFANVPVSAWTYELGGYPVLKKWLGYRHLNRNDGRPLSLTDHQHFRSMTQRLAALEMLGSELDEHYASAAASAFSAEDLSVG